MAGSRSVVFDAVSRSWNRFDWKPRPCKRSLKLAEETMAVSKTSTDWWILELVEKQCTFSKTRTDLRLLRDEVAQSRLAVSPLKNTVKFNVSRKSYWDVDRAARCLKRKKIRDYLRNATEILPAEFKPIEVRIITKFPWLVLIIIWQAILRPNWAFWVANIRSGFYSTDHYHGNGPFVYFFSFARSLPGNSKSRETQRGKKNWKFSSKSLSLKKIDWQHGKR